MSAHGHLAVIFGVILLAAAATTLRESTTYAMFSDTERGLARFTGDVPIASCAAIWADSTDAAALKITGSDHDFFSCLHSNGGAELGGARGEYHRTVRHAGEYKTNENGHSLYAGAVQVSPAVFPYPYTTSDYEPTGCKARQAANQGNYYSYVGSTIQLKPPLVREGLHYVIGNAVVDLTGFSGNITVVATGRVDMAAGPAGAHAYVDSLLAHAGASGPNALKFTGNGGRVTGSVYAPHGEVSFSAQENDYRGQIMGWRVTVSGSLSSFRSDPPASYVPCSA